MQVIIVGCGRVGASTAAELARGGHSVVVIDRNPDAFRLLPGNFSGRTLVGTGFDREVLESAGIREADALVASTSGDNTNAIAARIAKEVYRVPDVVARIFDPQRADIYRRYGVQAFAPTAWFSVSPPFTGSRWPMLSACMLMSCLSLAKMPPANPLG